MRIKRVIWAGVGVLACVGAALWMRELASWRPVKMAVVGALGELHVSADGKSVWMGEVGGQGQAYWFEPNTLDLRDAPPNYETFRLFKGVETYPILVRRNDGIQFKARPGAKIVTVPEAGGFGMSLKRREIYTHNFWAEPSDGEISIWEMSNGRLKRRVFFGKEKSDRHGTFSPDGKWLLAAEAPPQISAGVRVPEGESPSQLRRYDVQTGKVMTKPDISDYSGGMGRLKFSPDGKHLLVGVGAGNARALIFDASSWKLAWRADGIINADWLPDGQLGITQAEGLEWRDAATGKLTQTRFGPLSTTRFWTTSPDGKYVYAADDKGTIRRWRAR